MAAVDDAAAAVAGENGDHPDLASVTPTAGVPPAGGGDSTAAVTVASGPGWAERPQCLPRSAGCY